MNRGDVVLAFYPFASGSGGKRRPGLVVQNDADNARMAATILAQITTNLARAGEPTHLLIETSTTEGQQSGLLHDSLVSCNITPATKIRTNPYSRFGPTTADHGSRRSEINHGIHRNTRKRESESTSPFRVLPCFPWLPVCDDLSCRGNNLVTVELTRIHKVIGRLPAATMQRIDDCLRAALGLP